MMKPEQPGKMAVSMRWDQTGAPQVTAKGRGPVAEEIIALAKKHDIPVREDNELAQLLVTVKLGDEIPHELYLAVAEVIAFAYRLRGDSPVKA